MKLQKIYTSFLTSDLVKAEDWYTKLLGREPDNRPMKTLLQWELFDGAGLGISTDEEISGRGTIFLYVNDLDIERQRLERLGIILGDDIKGDYSTLAQLRDFDDNLITLASSPEFPPA